MIPAINGVNQNQSVQIGSTIDPFNGITVTDGNDYLSNTTLTISLDDANGNASDNNGKLVLNDDGNGDTMKETSSGVYVLTDTQPGSPSRTLDFFTHQLPALQFIPSNAAVTTIKITENDKYNETATASLKVTATGSGSPANVNTVTSTTAATSTSNNGGDITENGGVGGGTTDTVSGDNQLTLNDPTDFKGQVDFKSGIIDLNGLADVTSFTFKNDMLTLYSNGNSVDTLSFTGDSRNTFAVAKLDSGTVSIYTSDDPRHSSNPGSLLPNHS